MSVFSSKDRYCGAVLGAFVALIKVSLTCCMKVGQRHECNAVSLRAAEQEAAGDGPRCPSDPAASHLSAAVRCFRLPEY